MSDPESPDERRHRDLRLRHLARRLFREIQPGEPDTAEPAAARPAQAGSAAEPSEPVPPKKEKKERGELRDLLGSLLETGDKARMEIARMFAREVRGYIEAMELSKDLNNLLTNYSLEVHASVSLKPLASDQDAVQQGQSSSGVSLKKKPEQP